MTTNCFFGCAILRVNHIEIVMEFENMLKTIQSIKDFKTMGNLLCHFENTKISEKLLTAIKQSMIDFLKKEKNNTNNQKIIQKIYKKTLSINQVLPLVVIQHALSFLDSIKTSQSAVVCQDFYTT